MKLFTSSLKLTLNGTLKGAEYLIKGKLLDKKTGAKFLENKEIKNFLSSSNKGLLLDGDDKRLSEKESYQNLCYTARVGVGKTTKYTIPNVLDKASQNASLVIHDPKGEVFNLTSGYMQAKGYNVVVFNPENPAQSNRFNSLTEAKNEIEIEQNAETIIWAGNPNQADPYWNNGATRILSVILKCLSYGEKRFFNLPNLQHLLQNFGETGEGIENWIASNCWNPKNPNDPSTLNEWKGAITGNKEAIQSFIGICLTALKPLSNSDLRLFFSKSDYDLSNLRKQKTAIYFITPANRQKYYSFATSLFFSAIFNECMRAEHLNNKSLPVYILYDEFGNSYISDFVSVANTIRGYGVSLSIILQSISQLAMRYDQKTAESIQGAINTNICLAGADPVTADYFSHLSGKVRETQKRGNIYDLSNQNTDYREYNLLNSNEVRTMQDNEALIISKNRNPVKLKTKPYYEERKFNRASQFPPAFINRASPSLNIDLVDLS